MDKKVELYDTTLRDGTQQEGISLSVEDKLAITQRLDQLGIDVIEGGYAGANPKDDECAFKDWTHSFSNHFQNRSSTSFCGPNTIDTNQFNLMTYANLQSSLVYDQNSLLSNSSLNNCSPVCA